MNSPTDQGTSASAIKETFKRWLDRLLIVHFTLGLLYPAYVIFFILKPEGQTTSGPLFSLAGSISFELMVKRRLYALEFWLISLLMIVYFANRKRIFGWK